MRKTNAENGQTRRSPVGLFELPLYMNNGSFHIEMDSTRALTVDGCTGVLLCETEQIRLGLAQGALLILGAELSIDGMSGTSVCVRGRICSVEFI